MWTLETLCYVLMRDSYHVNARAAGLYPPPPRRLFVPQFLRSERGSWFNYCLTTLLRHPFMQIIQMQGWFWNSCWISVTQLKLYRLLMRPKRWVEFNFAILYVDEVANKQLNTWRCLQSAVILYLQNKHISLAGRCWISAGQSRIWAKCRISSSLLLIFISLSFMTSVNLVMWPY
jgi:hypothetical protein